MAAVFSVPLASRVKRLLCCEPLPSTRVNEWVALASGSVALNSPTTVPVGRFSATVVPFRSMADGGWL